MAIVRLGVAVDESEPEGRREVLGGFGEGHVVDDQQQSAPAADPALDGGNLGLAERGRRRKAPVTLTVALTQGVGDHQDVERCQGLPGESGCEGFDGEAIALQ